jgi:hypothetical protein
MVIKQTLRWAGLAGLVALAACNGPLGPDSYCSTDPENSSTICSPPLSEQAADPIDL